MKYSVADQMESRVFSKSFRRTYLAVLVEDLIQELWNQALIQNTFRISAGMFFVGQPISCKF